MSIATLEQFDRTCVEISLDNIKSNYVNILKNVTEGCEVMAVVKANAYGHGAVKCAKALREVGARSFCVATVDEAIELRDNGIDDRILILGFIDSNRIGDLIKYDINPAVYDKIFAKKLSEEATKQGKTVDIHIKIDTGMSRIGFMADESSIEDVVEICSLPGINSYGIFSHFASADTEDDDYTFQQFEKFTKFINGLETRGIRFKMRHICNSAGIMRFPQMHLDGVRAGIILYGYLPQGCPQEEELKERMKLRPVMTWLTRVIHVKDVEEGTTVSYGRHFKASTRTRVATCAAGYADGMNRRLSNGFKVRIKGKEVSIIGNVCMDMFMIDVSGLDDIKVGEVVNLVSEDNDATYMADYLGTINYEITCGVSLRVEKFYIENGKVIG